MTHILPITQATGETMGGQWALRYWGAAPPSQVAVAAVVQAAFDKIDTQMSPYKSHSDICRFNRAPVNEWVEIPPEMAQVVAAGLEIGALSGGALDITIGALVNMWGFGPVAKPLSLPAAAERDAALRVTGLQNLSLSDSGTYLRKTAALQLDLCAAAKGYGVDHVAACLRGLGLTHFIIEAAGEALACGARPDGTPWLIGVELPVPGKSLLLSRLALRDMAVASSGQYRNFATIDGQDMCHMIDPQTGMPISDPLLSVCVVDKSCMRADALATALMALGADKGRAMAVKQQIDALFMIKSAEGFWQIATGHFENHLAKVSV
ncbi:MAG: FAD:protein FMN transferase [Rhodobacteraceae bacterium]|nr:FAD:protein FMN transferase [Paracoccaceae bacterium]